MKQWYQELDERFLKNDEVLSELIEELEYKYLNIFRHSKRVAFLSYLLMMDKYPKERALILSLGALFHDIGKLNIESRILFSNSKSLNRKDLEIYNRHSKYGKNLISGSDHEGDLGYLLSSHHDKSEIRRHNELRILSISNYFDNLYDKHKEIRKCIFLLRKEAFYSKSLINRLVLAVNICDFYYEKDETILKNYKYSNKSINYLDIFSSIEDKGVIVVDKDDKIIFANKKGAAIRNREINQIVNTSFFELYKEKRRRIIKERVHKLKTGEDRYWERRMGRLEKKVYSNKYYRIDDENGDYQGIILISEDITKFELMIDKKSKKLDFLKIIRDSQLSFCKFKNLEEARISLKNILNKIFDIKNIVFFTKDDEINIYGNIENFSCENVELIKYYQENRVWLPFLKYKNHQKTMIYRELKTREIKFGLVIEVMNELNPEERTIFESIIETFKLNLDNYFLNTKNKKNAITDQLTGVYNRRFLYEKISDIKKDSRMLFVVIDMDNMKYINDNYGHFEGDRYITSFIGIIKRFTNENSYVFRTGGDEFLLLANEESINIIEKIIEKIKRKFSNIKIGYDFKPSFSAGYAVKEEGECPFKAIERADKHMYLEKRKKPEVITI